MIAIVDYGLGNIKAFANVYKNLDVPFVIASKVDDLRKATRIVLPGVGAFDRAMQLLEKSGMGAALDELVLHRRVPVLGICVGMQMLAQSSEEGKLPGLGWISGVVKKFQAPSGTKKMLLPHMGWNSIYPKNGSVLLRDLGESPQFYFLHSYYFHCREDGHSIAETDYGIRFSSAINSGNVYGVQFHPEKSHRDGIRLLKNFWSLS